MEGEGWGGRQKMGRRGRWQNGRLELGEKRKTEALWKIRKET